MAAFLADAPCVLAVAGEVKAGKSSFMNAGGGIRQRRAGGVASARSGTLRLHLRN